MRKIHSLVRKNTAKMTRDEYAQKSKINQPWCPTLEITQTDFQTNCPAFNSEKCPFDFLCEYQSATGCFLSQGEMAVTQFGFVGLIILKPEFFGAHNVDDQDLEAFLHLWRGIGYLIGIDDE